MPPPSTRLRRCAAVLFTALLVSSGIALADPATSDPSSEKARALFEHARAVKRAARAPLLPQTRYTVRKQIESIEPISWLERYGEVEIREIQH